MSASCNGANFHAVGGDKSAGGSTPTTITCHYIVIISISLSFCLSVHLFFSFLLFECDCFFMLFRCNNTRRWLLACNRTIITSCTRKSTIICRAVSNANWNQNVYRELNATPHSTTHLPSAHYKISGLELLSHIQSVKMKMQLW